jgi:hypothetical protein
MLKKGSRWIDEAGGGSGEVEDNMNEIARISRSRKSLVKVLERRRQTERIQVIRNAEKGQRMSAEVDK